MPTTPQRIDRRTRKGQEETIIEQVIRFGGASCFWLSETQKRAHAVDRLTRRGVIEFRRGHPRNKYPWNVITIEPQ